MVYNDKLDDKVAKYNNAYHRSISIKPADVKPSNYVHFNKENNKKGPKFKASDDVRISKYKKILAKGYVPKGMLYVLKKFF